MTEFEKIRPYEDVEVQAVLRRLCGDREFLSVVGRFLLPRVLWWIVPAFRPVLAAALRRQTRHIDSVGDFQLALEPYFHGLLRRTVDRLEIEGATELARDSRPRLFIGNHRDIAMDSGLLNYALYVAGVPTARSAIGDNLLRRVYAADLMRLNKAFVVERDVSGVKAIARALHQTSAFIQASLAQGESVWIAQREGRAKDSRDRTDPAVLKMFAFSQRRSGQSLGSVLNRMNLTPVSVAYEWDPCDLDKARVLRALEEEGQYSKRGDEDMISIAQGVMGRKGRVCLRIGPVLEFPDDTDAESAALRVDRCVIGGYRLFPSNLLAWEAMDLVRDVPVERPAWLSERLDAIRPAERIAFGSRAAGCPATLRPYWFQIYGNPVEEKLRLGLSDADAGTCRR